MNKAVKNSSSALISDVLGLFGLPTATANQIYAEVMEKRKSEALEALFSELRQGQSLNVDKHELVSIIARYQRDAVEGTARKNLRLLAQIIRGMGQESKLTASNFNKYADALSSLTEDELTIIACMANEDGCYVSAQKVLLKKFSEEKYDALFQSLLRTGLIYFHQELSAEYIERRPTETEERYFSDTIKKVNTDFWTYFSFTPLMKEILDFLDGYIDENQLEKTAAA